MRSIFMCRPRQKVQDSLSVQWRAHESRGPSPSSWCEAASSQWQSVVRMMMAEGDESLQLPPPPRKRLSLPYGFFSGNVD